MRNQRWAPAVALVGLVLAGCNTQDEPQANVELDTPAQKASYGIGLNMGRSMAQEGMEDLDPQAVALGIEDALADNEQRVSDDELMEAFTALQTRAEERMAQANEEARKAGEAYLAENAQREGVTVTESGLQYEIVESSETGERPTPDNVVTVHYEGRLIDGTVFDSSLERGQPLDLPVGGVIQGWVEGLQLMREGETYKFYLPSELAYGEQSPSPTIPANSVLVFDIELLEVKDADGMSRSAAPVEESAGDLPAE
ncbi:FKBP-type peptidyl-prolyl cis-trans isomerase [Stutzerimonas tarimensis]|uniref:Peptidyl-prolyl cis-trans isomerase n=1 Tax=Stutzerimonas tarimensis TaxID=1507735 RepID=A0ABV7T548_9GAMM